MTYVRLANRNNDLFANSLVNQLFGETAQAKNGNHYSSSRQRVNVLEKDSEFILEMAIPGFSKEDVKLKVEKDQLKIVAEQEDTTEEQKYHRKEFEVSGFERNFKLSKKIDQDLIKAKVEDGVLRVSLPLKKEEQHVAKEIQVL